jgi:hypothetical protein
MSAAGDPFFSSLLRDQDEYVCLNQIRTIDHRRLFSKLGQIDTDTYHDPSRGCVVVGATRKNPCANFRRINTGRENRLLLPLISDPTFSPMLTRV